MYASVISRKDSIRVHVLHIVHINALTVCDIKYRYVMNLDVENCNPDLQGDMFRLLLLLMYVNGKFRDHTAEKVLTSVPKGSLRIKAVINYRRFISYVKE